MLRGIRNLVFGRSWNLELKVCVLIRGFYKFMEFLWEVD